jgi:PAS domain S-box-containing protein
MHWFSGGKKLARFAALAEHILPRFAGCDMNTLLNNAFHRAAVGMAFVSLRGRWLRANASLCQFLGYAQEELAALTFQALSPAAEFDVESGSCRLFNGKAESYHGDQCFYHKRGHLLWAVISACLVRGDTGNPQCYFLHIHEVPGRQGVEPMRESFFEPPTRLHFVANFDGYFEKLSPSWAEALGYPISYLLSVPYLDLVHPNDRENTVREAEQITQGFNTFVFENRYRHADGAYRWILWIATRKVEEGLISGVALDYTARKVAELNRERALLEARARLADVTESQKEFAKLREARLLVCAWTKRIYYDGRWMAVEEFLRDYLRLNLTHGVSEEAMTDLRAGVGRTPGR